MKTKQIMEIPLQSPFDAIFTISIMLVWIIYLIAMFNNLEKRNDIKDQKQKTFSPKPMQTTRGSYIACQNQVSPPKPARLNKTL